MSNHRRDVRPRYGRIGVLAASVTISAVAALGGFGILATSSAQAGASPKAAAYTPSASQSNAGDPSENDPSADSGGGQGSPQSGQPGNDTSAGSNTPDTSSAGSDASGDSQLQDSSLTGTSQTDTSAEKAVPADSGAGRRIVFSQSRQRVWLMGQSSDDVQKTYLVSGSVTHNLQPGTYSVYSKSRWAVGIDDSGVMQYFVRFTQGPTGAAIGFHSIPTKNGVPLQTRAQLGTPESHGCIRQYLPDAIALWDFAPEGTKVVVVA
jgi:lipoprotein-anchoring transpeptidase ErfK/SrfK